MSFGNDSSLLLTREASNCSLNLKTFESDSTIQIIICVFNSLTSVTAIVANLLVIISIFKTPSLHSPSNVLIVGLALSDFGVGLIVQPILQTGMISKIQGLVELYCTATVAQSVAGFSLCGISMTTLTLISLDRYAALHLHLRYQELVTIKRVTIVLVNVWLVLCCCGSSILWSDFTFIEKLSVAVISFTFILTGITYCLIYRVVRRHTIRIQSQMWAHVRKRGAQELNMPHLMKTSGSTFVISFAFLLCFLPYTIVRLVIDTTNQSVFKQSMYELAILLVFCNSALNPILYCWRFKRIRAAVIRTAKSIVFRGLMAKRKCKTGTAIVRKRLVLPQSMKAMVFLH